MPVFETLGLILTSATAKSIAKFLFEKIDEYTSNILGNKPSNEVVKLKKEIEDLKDKLESKESEEVTSAEVEELKEKLKQIEQKQTPLPASIISGEIFLTWSEKGELDAEDQALILKKQLEVLMDKAGDLGIKGQRRVRIQDIIVSIDVNIKRLKEAREIARRTGLSDDKQEIVKVEFLLRNTIFQARDLLRGY